VRSWQACLPEGWQNVLSLTSRYDLEALKMMPAGLKKSNKQKEVLLPGNADKEPKTKVCLSLQQHAMCTFICQKRIGLACAIWLFNINDSL